jgi:ankyrin repeat protein
MEICAPSLLSLQDSKDVVNGMNNNGRTPFDIAFENGFFNLAQQIKNVSDYDSYIDDEESFASTDGEDKEIRDRFLDNVNDIDTQSRSLIQRRRME